MALPQITDHMYVQAVFSRTDGDDCVNTFCFRNHRNVPGETFGSTAMMQSLRDLLDSFYGTRGSGTDVLGPILSPTTFNLRYVVYDLGQPNAGSREIPSATFPTAAGAGNPAPPDVSIVITWRTANRGRSYRGRTYVGPLGSTAIGPDGRPSPAARDRLLLAAPKLIGNPATRSWRIGVLSRTLSVCTPVTHGDVDTEFDTQRRRGFRVATRHRFVEPTTV